MMRCFNCEAEIKPEWDAEPTLMGNVNAHVFCVECGANMTVYEVSEEDVDKTVQAFVRACGGDK
jgi:hypothetical protein